MYRLKHALPTAMMLAVLLVATACDSGTSPEQSSNTTDPTVITFAGSETSVSERDTTVTVTVEVQNPGDSEVSAELLYAAGASSATIDDFNIDDATAVNDDETAFVLANITFPAGAEDGAQQSFTYTLTDDQDEPEAEVGVFALQKVTGALVGGQTFRVNIAAEGTVQLVSADFSDDELAPMTAYSVTSNENWETASFSGVENSPYAQCNGFRADELSNDWLITPALNTTGYQSVTLTFLNSKGFNDSGRRGLDVFVSTDYDGSGNPENFTWTDISDRVTFSGGDFEFVESGPVDITDFEGTDVYVGFNYTQSGIENAAQWQVDNIVVSAEE
ncbi:MAG: DUF5017 domain-containing protein [Bacteroidetes bacterium]|jgi:hypothetical protein|nr:DUF5017 domain-containing protein [Bacteroidota bacterium]